MASLRRRGCCLDVCEFCKEEESIDEKTLLNMSQLAIAVEEMIYSLVPDVSASDIALKMCETHLLLTVELIEDADKCGLLVGSKLCNIKLIVGLLRNQQLVPHDKYVCVRIETEDSVQDFWDKNVSAIRKSGDLLPLKVERNNK